MEHDFRSSFGIIGYGVEFGANIFNTSSLTNISRPNIFSIILLHKGDHAKLTSCTNIHIILACFNFININKIKIKHSRF